MLEPVVLPAAFFLSGAAGLIFQVVWLYRCGLVLGSSVAAITVVLSAFMAGLAAGNAVAAAAGSRLRVPVRTYAWLELVVGATGVAATYVLPLAAHVLVPLAHAVGPTGAAINAARFGVAFVVLAVPATAMGATLPVLVGALWRAGERLGPALGRLYGWNTFGAVAGVVGSEVLLISALGIPGTAWLAGALNVAAAALALSLGNGGSTDRTPELSRADRRVHGSRPRWPLLCATALSGALLLALEVAWFRFLSMYVLVTTLATSLMLGVVLTGIAVGGLAASAWIRRRPRASESLPAAACVGGLAVIGAYALFQFVTAGTQVGDWQDVLWFACVLTLPASAVSGLMFTLMGDRLHRAGDTAIASTGWLAFANTAGAIAGPPLAAYVLLPIAGLGGTFFVLALAYGIVGLLTAAALPVRVPDRSSRPGVVLRLATAAALLIALAAFPFDASSRYFVRAAAAYADDGSTIVATREGPAETLFVMQQEWLGKTVYSRLITNGFSMSGTALQGQRYMRAFAYYPMLLHDGPLRRALVVCYGVGVTVGAVTHIPSVQAIDVAEISNDVVAMSDAIYPAGSRPLDDPRVRLHVEDGRFFLQATTERYDLITGEPPPPRTPGTVNIYTREYFQLVHDRLADGGLATYWVPVARPHPGTDVNTIIRAFCDVFADCSLWNATPFDLMLVGSRGATGPRSSEQFTAPWQTPGLEARLREVAFERPEQIGATFVGDAAYLRELTAPTPPLVDDYPQRLRPARGRPSLSDPGYGTDPAVARMYASTLDVSRARAAFAASPLIRSLWPAPLIERTVPYFEQQAILNRVYWEGGHPLRQIEDLDRTLSQTTLRTLPLWILGSDEVKQRIAESTTAQGGATEYARGLRALSGRDYAGAAEWFDRASQAGLHSPEVVPLRAYALTKSGRSDAAAELASAAQPTDPDERHFWEWLRPQLAR